MPELTVIYWRDIPAQVTAIGRRPDRTGSSSPAASCWRSTTAAMHAGLVGSDDYLDEWRRETRECATDLEREVAERGRRASRRPFTADVLERLVDSGGQRSAVQPDRACAV